MKMNFQTSLLLRFKLFFFISLTSLYAQENNQTATFDRIQEGIDNTQSFLSKKVLNTTNWIDSFFGNKKSLDEQNGSRVRLFYILSKEESQDFDHTPSYKVDIRLPNLQKKIQISLESSQDSEAATPTPETQLSTESDSPVNTQGGERGSISYFFKELAETKFKLSAGARFGIPPRVFTNFRASKEHDLGYFWKLRAISNTFWEQDQGFGESLSMDFSKELSSNLNIRLVNEATWLDSSDTINASHGPTLFHILSKRRIVSYNYRQNYSNRPNYRLNEHLLNIVYRQNIHDNWLFYEMIPSLRFARYDHFHSHLGVTVKVECLIGSF